MKFFMLSKKKKNMKFFKIQLIQLLLNKHMKTTLTITVILIDCAKIN